MQLLTETFLIQNEALELLVKLKKPLARFSGSAT